MARQVVCEKQSNENKGHFTSFLDFLEMKPHKGFSPLLNLKMLCFLSPDLLSSEPVNRSKRLPDRFKAY